MSDYGENDYYTSLRHILDDVGYELLSLCSGKSNAGAYLDLTVKVRASGRVDELRIVLPPGVSPWDLANFERVGEVAKYGYKHYCSTTPTCAGGRNDTGDWDQVTCPECLMSKPSPRFPADTWYGFECRSNCRTKTDGSRTGCVLDVRLPFDEEPPTVLCPICQTPMHFRGRWAADDGGYGSRGDRR